MVITKDLCNYRYSFYLKVYLVILATLFWKNFRFTNELF